MLLSFVRILEPTFVVRSQAVLFKMGEGMGDVSEIQKRITQMRLWEFPDKYVFEPTDSLATQFLSIDRSSGDLNSISQLPDSNASHSQIVFGLVGVFRPVAAAYALVVNGRQSMGIYRGHPIYRVTSLKVLPCNNNIHGATPEVKKVRPTW